MTNASRLLQQETGSLDSRLALAQVLVSALPLSSFSRLRTLLYRMGGIQIGRGTLFYGRIKLTGPRNAAKRLKIGQSCFLNDALTFNLNGNVTVEDNVSIGMDCLFTTGVHEMGGHDFRAGPVQGKDITVGRGSWLAARVTVLPGVTIGAGSVVAAGAVVTDAVQPDTFVAGVPAREIRRLET